MRGTLPTREVVLRLTVTHADRRALEMFSREFAAPGTSWSPGTTGSGGRPSVSPVLAAGRLAHCRRSR